MVSLGPGRNEETRCRKTPFAISTTTGHVRPEPGTTTRGCISTKLAAFHAVFPRFIYVFHYANGNGLFFPSFYISRYQCRTPLLITHELPDYLFLSRLSPLIIFCSLSIRCSFNYLLYSLHSFTIVLYL